MPPSIAEALDSLELPATAVHTECGACHYLPDRQHTLIRVDEGACDSSGVYDELIEKGFEREGATLVRPSCQFCRACMPVRIPVNTFSPSPQQRRVLRRNRDLTVSLTGPPEDQEHFFLYRRYISARHAAGPMDSEDRESFPYLLLAEWAVTRCLEVRAPDGRLLAAAVTDKVRSGFCAAYTFFDPAESTRSLGIFTVLMQIEMARDCQVPFVYPGTLIRESPKMAYKSQFRPFDAFIDGRWVPDSELALHP